MSRCACDACTEIGQYAVGGYCAFCDNRCFPRQQVGRLEMSRESRLLLHQRATTVQARHAPTGGDLLTAALTLMGRKPPRNKVEAAAYLARTVAPYVGPAARAIVGRVLRRG